MRADPQIRRARRVVLGTILIGAVLVWEPLQLTAAGADDPVLTAVGDITRCDSTADDATAALAAEVPGPIAALGDLVEGKHPGEFADCFDPSGWGALRDRIRPVPGDNGEYGRGGADGIAGYEDAAPQLDDYFSYFGAAAGSPEQPYYSYDVGTWHVIALDANCSDEPDGCEEDSPMQRWLEEDLAAHPVHCTAVTMHHNFIDQPGKTFSSLEPLLEAMYDHGVDLVISGHRHTYRRYAPVDLDGERDEDHGLRQFIVGTGGHRRSSRNVVEGGALERIIDDSYGVARFTLRSGGYDFEFVPADVSDSAPVSDSGSGTCHWGPHGPPPSAPSTSTSTTAPVAPPASKPAPAPPADAERSPSQPVARSGYWMLGSDGRVFPFGEAVSLGDGAVGSVDVEPSPSGNGYWIVDGAGQVSAHGDAALWGSVDRSRLAAGEQVTSLSATPSGGGYWVLTSRGRALAFGDAVHFGDMSAVTLNGPVLDSIATPSGQGYYMAAADGGIFSFGDARFHGSMGGIPLNDPVQSLVPDPDGVGYWLVASDGGVFAFEAGFRGSMGDTPLNRPVSGMVAFGNGYLMVGEDGGIFNFSDRPFHGSLGDNPPPHPIVAVAALD